jgi:hypothetical protein
VNFRQRLYDALVYRADALFNLLDSLRGNTTAQSVVELSRNAPFARQYSSLHDGVDKLQLRGSSTETAPAATTAAALAWVGLLAEALPRPAERPCWLLGLDTTPAVRPVAETLVDRGVGYYPNPASGNQPLGVGPCDSVVARLPECGSQEAPWVVPRRGERVPTAKKAQAVAVAPVVGVLTHPQLPLARELSVEVGDWHYSHAGYRSPVGGYEHHVVIARLAANRTRYRVPPPGTHAGPGQPRWYGEPVHRSPAETLGPPDDTAERDGYSRSGRRWRVQLPRWHHRRLRGTHDAPMHNWPFDLSRATVTDAQGQPRFHRSVWLLVRGSRRWEISLVQAYPAYGQRYDLEPFFRFGKTKRLLDRDQTPCVEHEEHWWQWVCLAYIQLWLAAPLAVWLPRPWERYAATESARAVPGPGPGQRQFERIIRQLGTPARLPKRRGNSPGRAPGHCPGHRPRQPVVFKRRSRPKKAA